MIVSPIYISLPRKKGGSKKISLNINWYRNAHYRENNAVKTQYRHMMAPQLQRLPKIKKMPISFHMTLFPSCQCDGANVIAIVDKFFADAFVCYTNLPDDNLKFITSGSWEFGGFDKKNPRCEIEVCQP